MDVVILDMIIELIKAIKENKECLKSSYKKRELVLSDSRYILNQMIRKLNVLEDHYLISAKAKEKWNQLTMEDIESKFYRESITVDSDTPVEIMEYKSNSKEGKKRTINKGEKFIYRDVFHNEHIVPISMIIDALLQLKELNYENILEVLDKIYVCRMLKEEDRRILAKSKRYLDYKRVIEDFYEKADIKIG